LATSTIDLNDLEEKIRSLRGSSKALVELAANAPVFDPDWWPSQAQPAAPEELAEMDEILAELREDRRREIEAELPRG
jgi:hypothetical protein